MPYKTIEAQRAYQRGSVAGRRAGWLAGKSCVDCGSTTDLELDHRDPAEKESHKIWSWSWERIEAEAAKCDIRCAPCHHERHAAERRKHGAGGYKRGCRCIACRAWKVGASAREKQRPRPESNRDDSLCRRARSRSATRPDGQPYRDEAA